MTGKASSVSVTLRFNCIVTELNQQLEHAWFQTELQLTVDKSISWRKEKKLPTIRTMH